MNFVIKHTDHMEATEQFLITKDLPMTGEVEVLGKISDETFVGVKDGLSEVAMSCPELILANVKRSPISGTVLLFYKDNGKLIMSFRCRSHLVTIKTT